MLLALEEMRRENSEQNILRGAMPMMRKQESDEEQGMDEVFLQEYERFLSNSDAEWECLQRHLPPQPKRGRSPTHSWRAMYDAIFYVLRTGCPWRYLPADFPPWQTVFYHFRRLRRVRDLDALVACIAPSRT